MEFWPEFLAKNSKWKEFVAGGVGGMAGVVSGHPLDTLKVRLQQPGQEGGAMAVLRRMWRTEGPTALFKGMGAPVATVAFQNAVSFQAYASLIRTLSPEELDQARVAPSYATVALAGAGAGILQTLILTPVDLLKIRLQVAEEPVSSSKIAASKLALSNAISATRLPISGPSLTAADRAAIDNPSRQTPRPLQILRTILRIEGIRGLYRGMGVTLLRDAPGFSSYFTIYEVARETIEPGCRASGDEGIWTMLTAGGLAGSLSWLICYPIDVVKSRLQAQGTGSSTKYTGIVDCFRKSVAEEGWGVLSRGLGVTVARAFVVNASIFAAYEMSLRSLKAQV